LEAQKALRSFDKLTIRANGEVLLGLLTASGGFDEPWWYQPTVTGSPSTSSGRTGFGLFSLLSVLFMAGVNTNNTIDPARFIREFVRAEPVEAQPFDRLRANGSHV
jgi:hypothetical protein